MPCVRSIAVAICQVALAAIFFSPCAKAEHVLLDCDSAFRSEIIARRNDNEGGELVVEAAVSTAKAVLVFEETGADLEWRRGDEAGFRDVESRPLRFGTMALPLLRGDTLVLRMKATAVRDANVGLRFYCDPPPEIVTLPVCVAALRSPVTDLIARKNGLCSALQLHAAASDAARRGENEISLQQYRDAGKVWRSRGDVLREGAALLGATEALFRLGRFEEAISMAQDSATSSRRAKNIYFAVRAQSETCLALRELGERRKAKECQEPLPADYLQQGETGDAANALITLGSMANDDDDMAMLEFALSELAKLDEHKFPPHVMPRSRLLRASLYQSEGRSALALEQLDLAASGFEAQGNRRWLANVYLRVATIYGQLGAWEESRLFALEASKNLPVDQAPARRAEAIRALAIAEVNLGDDEASATHFAEARRSLVTAKVPLGILSLDIDESLIRRDPAALRQALSSGRADIEARPSQLARLQLARAQHALLEGDAREATRLLENMPENRLGLDEHLQWQMLRAQLLARSGQEIQALGQIEREVGVLRFNALTASAPALRHIAGRRLLELRAAWIDIYVAMQPATRPEPEALWQLLRQTQPASLLGTGGRHPDAAFNRALADLMFRVRDENDDAGAQMTAQRSLLRYYADSREHVDAPMPTLDAVQRDLPDDARLLAFALGRDRVLLMIVDRNAVVVRTLGTASSLRLLVMALKSSLASPQVPMSEIGAAAASLSEFLFAGENSPAPARLLLMLDDVLASVPFTLLNWPNQGMLLDSSAISLMPAGPVAGSFERLRGGAVVQVMTAAQGGAGGLLDVLPGASDEAARIRSILPAREIAAYGEGAFSRDRLQQSLEQPDAWLHVAAHGFNDPRLQNYSGIWLASSMPLGQPDFVSWLDLIERPLHAQLLVLNACSLAGSSVHGMAGAANFATALNAAGVHHVVAVLWPLSDAAAGHFVKTFYATIDRAEARGAAFAMAEGQRRLRASAHFRHPYYWSLFVHLQR